MAGDKITDNKKPMMRDYWGKFSSRALGIIIGGQTFVVMLVFAGLELLGITRLGWLMCFEVALIVATIMSVISVIIATLIGKPFHDLVRAIVLVSDEPSAVTPPNPNKYTKDGFKEILQSVYQMAAAHDSTDSASEAPVDNVVTSGLDSMSTGIVIMDSSQNIIYHNRHAPVRTDVEGKDVLEAIFPDDDSVEKWLRGAAKNKSNAEHQWTRISNRLPGEKDRRIFDVAANFHRNSKAQTVLTFFDRTNQYTPEEDDLDFISFAAHELRGPITVIRGYLDVLDDELKDKLEQDQAELLQRLTVASNRLSSYVNNILNASRYDRRHLKLHLVEENVRNIYDQITDDMHLRAQAQNRVLIVDIPIDLPTVAADGNAVGEVISNLVDNAIKYSNEGGLVHVMARAVPDFVEISVIDRGIGMPSNVLQNLFHKFYRSHRSRETVAGTGIGLYICRAIVSSHGGIITARSVENEGSTFSFTLPIYDTVAEKLKAGDNSNVTLIEHGSGWIRNHSLYRG